MLKTFRASRSNVVVWAILVLLIIGLAGFGISTGAGGGQTVAEVGDTRIEADAYTRALDQELRAITGQIGRALPMSEARQFGVDRMVLARLISDAALDHEAGVLGLSTGDATVEAMVLATPAFGGAAGGFDRQAYAFALERAGLTPTQFETMLRAEATREMIAGSVQAAAAMPDTAANAILNFAGEARSFEWLALDADLLETPAAAPDAATLAAFHAANSARYTRPETRVVSYALLAPEALAASIEISEDDLRAAYAAAADRFATPARRILDRIGFGTPEEAAAALARIEAGEIDFDALAVERGLSPDEIDQGALDRGDLAPEAAEAVFAAAGPGLVGPVPTPLGPSLYRINAVLAATTTPFEVAAGELRAERALEAAQALIADAAAPVEDLLAGGARLEEIAAETDFALGEIRLDATSTGGLADDPAFREAAEAAPVDQETDLVELASGGLVALRVNAVEPAAPIPFAEVRERVTTDWTAEENARLLEAFAETRAAELAGGLAMADLAARLGRPVRTAGPLVRSDVLAEAPTGLIAAIFAAEPDGVVVQSTDGRVALAQVTEVRPFDPASPETAPLVTGIADELRAQAAEDLLALYIQAVQTRAGVTVNQALIDQVLAQYP